MIGIVVKIRRHGILGSAHKAINLLQRISNSAYHKWRCRNAMVYAGPTPDELVVIEQDLCALNINIDDYAPASAAFKKFQDEKWFPQDYHGGQDSRVWDEKLLEHWLTSERLGLMNYGKDDIFVDVAAASSPWAKTLRERKDISTFAIDLDEVDPAYRQFPYYRVENATKTNFQDASVRGVALHCAYEMFMRDDDTNLLKELARILKPGGRAIIAPLYLHTHYSSYSSPKYYGKGYSDPLAKEYLYSEWDGIPSARFYDANELNKRVLKPIESFGMHYKLLVLRNKDSFGKGIYCHFILEIER